MKDYSNSRYFAISGIGYGKGDSPVEAIENYVASQLRNIPASRTIFGTKKAWEAALRNDPAASARVWRAPLGATGFVLGYDGLQWELGGRYVPAKTDHELVCATCGKVEFEHGSDCPIFTDR